MDSKVSLALGEVEWKIVSPNLLASRWGPKLLTHSGRPRSVAAPALVLPLSQCCRSHDVAAPTMLLSLGVAAASNIFPVSG